MSLEMLLQRFRSGRSNAGGLFPLCRLFAFVGGSSDGRTQLKTASFPSLPRRPPGQAMGEDEVGRDRANRRNRRLRR